MFKKQQRFCWLTAVFLILSIPTVVLPVATEDAGYAAIGVGTFELTWQAHMDIWETTTTKKNLKWTTSY